MISRDARNETNSEKESGRCGSKKKKKKKNETDKVTKKKIVQYARAIVCLHSVRDLIFFYNSDDERERLERKGV